MSAPIPIPPANPAATDELKRYGRVLSLVGALALLTLLLLFPGGLVFHMVRQRNAGVRYMDSLTPEMCKDWEARTNAILAKPTPERDPEYPHYTMEGKSVPPELKQLKIFRISVGGNYVSYDWLGGMDHTSLIVKKLEDGSFKLQGAYDDAHEPIDLPRKR